MFCSWHEPNEGVFIWLLTHAVEGTKSRTIDHSFEHNSLICVCAHNELLEQNSKHSYRTQIGVSDAVKGNLKMMCCSDSMSILLLLHFVLELSCFGGLLCWYVGCPSKSVKDRVLV